MPENVMTPGMPKGPSARSEIGIDDMENPGRESSGDHGTKFNNAGAAGDAMVANKFNEVGNIVYRTDPVTPMKLKGG